jgi:hypothetical protein
VRAAPDPASAATATMKHSSENYVAAQNYENLCSNMGSIKQRPVSGYVGRWQRFKGSESQLLAEGDIIYGFR